MPNFAVILPAAGKSTRFNDPAHKKPFARLGEKAVWLYSAELFLKRNDVKQLIIVIDEADKEDFKFRFGANLAINGIQVAFGGKERSDSVRNALEKLNEDIDFVAIHDAARPLIANDWVDRVFAEAQKSAAAILALPVAGTLKRAQNSNPEEKEAVSISETVPRAGLWEAQTPQVFKRELIEKAYANLGSVPVTDDAQAVEKIGHQVSMVPGSPINFKITTKADLHMAKFALQALPKANPLNALGFSNPGQ